MRKFAEYKYCETESEAVKFDFPPMRSRAVLVPCLSQSELCWGIRAPDCSSCCSFPVIAKPDRDWAGEREVKSLTTYRYFIWRQLNLAEMADPKKGWVGWELFSSPLSSEPWKCWNKPPGILTENCQSLLSDMISTGAGLTFTWQNTWKILFQHFIW